MVLILAHCHNLFKKSQNKENYVFNKKSLQPHVLFLEKIIGFSSFFLLKKQDLHILIYILEKNIQHINTNKFL